MVKLFFPSSHRYSLTLFRSRLSQQITAWVFFSIVVIEGVLFVPSYGRRHAEELRKLETVSQEVLMSVRGEIMGDMPEQTILRHVRLREDSVIKGVSLHDKNGQLVDSVGEVTAFEPGVFTESAEVPFWPMKKGNDWASIAVRTLAEDGSRYDVAWPSDDPQVRYMLAIRHDATAVQRRMRAYAFGVMCLVIIISAFVTLVTLSVLQRIVIRPLMLLRDDLSAVRDAIAQGQTPDFASYKHVPENELGEVSVAFRNMFEWIHQEICNREEAEAGLRLEQEKTNRLLLNILPAAIAAQLKDSENRQGAIADRFETATILFADIVKFTEIAAETGPTELVCQLNDIFSAFDAIAERHGLEKIKTIGDAYMVVGGVPSPQKNHAKAVMAMAIEMMEFAASYPLGERKL
ncbi:MAG: adenylate/guanylate cyclase domain-containing protein, partial [Cyanobacteria bacterium P01_F01_bin.3]